jgi:hypothetical protein
MPIAALVQSGNYRGLVTADYVVGRRTEHSSLTSRKSPEQFQINSGTLAKCLIWSAYAGD